MLEHQTLSLKGQVRNVHFSEHIPEDDSILLLQWGFADECTIMLRIPENVRQQLEIRILGLQRKMGYLSLIAVSYATDVEMSYVSR